jgi:hypothetical protein
MAPLSDDDAGALATKLDAAIGEWSLFHETHGFYVQGVGRKTAILPTGWEDRLVSVVGPNTRGRTGLCLDPHDLCLAKLVAHREKDFVFVSALIRANLINPDVLESRVEEMRTADPRSRKAIREWIAATRPDRE